MRRYAPLWTSLLVVAAASAIAGGTRAAQAGEFGPDDGPDFNCDGLRDGVVAVPWDVVNGIDGAGAVTVTYGGGRQQRITQATAGVPGGPEESDGFGESYTWYDRNGDGCDDLVVGTPHEAIGSLNAAGTVTVIPGAPAGLNTASSTEYTQDSSGYPGEVEAGDAFGGSLAAGQTSQGAPYLLIGAPHESGPDIWTSSGGAFYYVRGGSVSMVHQDSPGVAGAREFDDLFGWSLAASERFFAVGSDGETVGSASGAGMVHVFSHTMSGGRPTPVGAFHQDTVGISGVAEDWDLFGMSLSITSYRPSSTQPIGAMVAVGASGEAVGAAESAGIVHLVHVSPQGTLRERVAVTQNTAGVTDTAEEADLFGFDVVVASHHSTSVVATPQTLAWAVAATQEVLAGTVGAVHAFRPGWQPGQPDIQLREGLSGLEEMGQVDQLRSSRSRLLMGTRASSCLTVGWSDLFDGGVLAPEPRPFDDCG